MAGVLPHRSVANIKSPGGPNSGSGPSTPMRPITSTFASPSSLRADEDIIVIEFDTRKLQVGFAGDSTPRGTIWFGPDQQRRVGDFRAWLPDYVTDWRQRATGDQWGKDYELWQYDIRDQDLGVVGDRAERALREAFTKYLLIDSRPRRMVCVLPSGLPVPLLSAVLDSLFSRFQPPTVALLSPTVSLAVAAGVRSALIVDLGWSETVVTSIYEYREVHCARSVRGGRMLTEQTHDFLAKHLSQAPKEPTQDNHEQDREYVLSFEECSGIAARLVWCKPSQTSAAAKPAEGLPTVQEHDECEEVQGTSPAKEPTVVNIPLKSAGSPMSLELPLDSLTEPCENAFFDTRYDSHSSFDDHELPLHVLVYRSLLKLPMDVRSICMSRIIFTGGGANVLGLRQRIFGEVSHLVQERGWDAVEGKAVEQLRANPKLKRQATRQAGHGSTGVASQSGNSVGAEQDGVWHDAANVVPEVDPIEEQLKGGTDKRPRAQGEMRAIESLGAWTGASLITHLKVPAIATIDRELWLQQGASGASRASEVDVKAQQRQSLGPGGLMRGASAGAPWTLGIWGTS
ncbi:hypothetical protein B0H66DRAFT_535679 [Apodospora peruviana]|uniref:Actin-like ATPase domain-containing protein n=1 Tax=Apodospora peruviana TaxID=516989 RepID=A0AAE0HY68_9PEZI|nr:hypothetical protein B0H66DRAFT_535679 [Apodospora peruviana]